MLSRPFLLAVLSLLMPTLAPAQISDTTFTPNIEPTLTIARRTGEITIDGDLSDAGWRTLQRAKNFTETSPVQKAKPLSETEGLLTYDDEYLYVAMVAYDDPASIRASLTTRDNIFNDDVMGIIFDPYGDGIRAYELYSNPLGIQGDLLWTKDGDDGSYDMLYESEARITSSGYQIEMRIPFKSLRFPTRDIQTWKITFWRIHPRENKHRYSWAALDRDNPCTFCQFGQLVGLEGVHSGSSLEVLPALVTKQLSSRNEDDRLQADPVRLDPSLSVRYGLSAAASLEATVNPDFSQVESDATQIDLNSSVALFYPERRPFFREGYDLFDTWINVVYTRAINDPLWAGKILNRSGSTNVAVLAAQDEHSPILVPLEERTLLTELGKSFVTIGRASHAFDGNHAVGLLLTDRRFDGGAYNSVIGGDVRALLFSDLQFEAQVLGSQTSRMEDTNHVSAGTIGALAGARRSGYAAYLSLERFTSTWDLDVDVNVTSPEFRAASGYITRSNQRTVSVWSGYKIPVANSLLVELRPNISLGRQWNFEGVRKDEWLVPAVNATIKGQTEVRVDYLFSRERYREKNFDAIRRFSASIDSRFSDPLAAGVSIQSGRSIARNVADPVLGHILAWDVWAQIKPHSSFTLMPTLSYVKLDGPTGENFFEVAVLRTRFNYQFNRELSARLIFEYDDYSHSVSVEPLLTYRINPYSVFYIGSTHAYAPPDAAGMLRARESARQIFAKVQYLFQV